MSNAADPVHAQSSLFRVTHWSEILPGGTAGGANMDAVCEAYREPLLLYLLCLHHKPEDASDLVQGFFADLIRRDALNAVSPKKGRFRSFLITSLRNYLGDQRDRANTHKRGGGQHRRFRSMSCFLGKAWIVPW